MSQEQREKNNVIPGVATATALRAPLCTAGFGLANGYIYYFFRRSLFILYQFGFHLYWHLPDRPLPEVSQKGIRESKAGETRIPYNMVAGHSHGIAKYYLAYNLVDNSIFETNARKFVASEFHFARTQVVNESFSWDGGKKTINLLLIGEELDGPTLDTIKGRLPKYKLDKAQLIITQGLNASHEIDFSAIKASILQDVFSKTDSTKKTTVEHPMKKIFVQRSKRCIRM